MPIYEYSCSCGKDFDRYLPVAQYLSPQTCECGQIAQKVIRTPPIGFVQQDICYDSPIDGRPITSMAARKEDLARANCVEYDPEMRKDADRARERSQMELEAKVDTFVEQEFEKMPSVKREKLTAELENGVSADILRK